jgi:hypothetical protein
VNPGTPPITQEVTSPMLIDAKASYPKQYPSGGNAKRSFGIAGASCL